MNITFWLIIGVFWICAFVFLLPPLIRNKKIKDADAQQRNLKIAQQRAHDLKEQLKAGALTQQQFDEQYEELALNLDDDLGTEQMHDRSVGNGYWIVPVVVAFVPLVSVVLYFSLGDPDALKKAQLQQAQQTATPSQEDIIRMVEGLAQRLKNEPENAEGWFMLGRSYKYLKMHDEALKAFEKAYALIGDQPEILLQYADTLAMVNNGRLAGKPTKLIEKALQKDPNSVMGLWLAGMAKVEVGKNAEALQHWRKLETILPSGSNSLKEIQGMIATIMEKAGMDNGKQTTALTKTSKTKSVSAASIEVKVSINKTLKAKVSPSDTVFIYAKALTGPPMPLAIIKKKVANLPLSVTLTDAMAMMPAMKLSNFKQVKVVARVSKSGTAMQQKGDFIGTVDVTELLPKSAVMIVINEEIK